VPHISLPEGAPGIVGLLTAYPDAAQHLSALAQTVLRGPSTLTAAEREIIAAFVSSRNECEFCMNSHAGAARHLLPGSSELVDEILANPNSERVSRKLRALLAIADKTRNGGRLVTEEDIGKARAAGADDQAIHDTVLIAAMFCMYNRYVDGLATTTPHDSALYDEMGARLASQGYCSA
jgi:uncharacterized peroxidase-related enzyme